MGEVGDVPSMTLPIGMSDEALIGAVSIVVAAIAGMVTTFLNFKFNVIKHGQDQAASRDVKKSKRVRRIAVELRKSTLTTAAKMDELKHTGNQTHSLVNGNMGLQLRITVALARRAAALSNNDPADVLALDMAEKALAEHEKRQQKADGVGNG